MREKMKIAKNKGIFALTAIVLLLTIAIAPQLGAANGIPVTLRVVSSNETVIETGNVSARVRVVDNPPPSSSAISCSVSPTSVTLGNSTTVSGSISPAVSGAPITLTYAKPDGTTLTRTATSGTDGSFTDIYNPDAVGSWSVTTSWPGNDAYFGATSFAAAFTVTESPAAAGIPMEYVYAAVVIIIIVIVALAAYWYTKKK
jgi:hypothetical protein